MKMEAHDLAEWSYYPEAGEVCPRGWPGGKRGQVWGASLHAGGGCGVAQVGTPGVGVGEKAFRQQVHAMAGFQRKEKFSMKPRGHPREVLIK